MPKEAVREAPRGAAHVKAGLTRRAHTKGLEATLELEAATAHVGRPTPEVDHGICGHTLTRRLEPPSCGRDLTRHDGAQCLSPRRKEAAGDQLIVEAPSLGHVSSPGRLRHPRCQRFLEPVRPRRHQKTFSTALVVSSYHEALPSPRR